jgi:predicted glycogen debranching enzyme
MGENKFKDFSYAQSLEWLETNGLGGYASSSVSGAHTRKYHGLLVASFKPPVERYVVLSKLDEKLVTDDQIFELSSNQYPGTVYPQGYQHIEKFSRELFPEFIYEAGGIRLKKTIACVQGENTTLVLYEVVTAPKAFTMELYPFTSFRDFHSLCHANGSLYPGYVFNEGTFQTKNYQESPELFINIPGSDFQPLHQWYHNFEYAAEHARGMEFTEDLYNHGKFVLQLKKGSKVGVVISVDDPTGKDAFKLFAAEKKRREGLMKPFSYDKNVARLALAADQFVVNRGTDMKTIVAGYPWFSDWGRDTMISLPGLCLVTKRFDDAKKILKTFADQVSEGMLPNRFFDYGDRAEYNNVDATLWFFNAIYKYWTYSNDGDFVKTLLPVLKNIIAWHYKGTRYNIHVDPEDELIFAGQDGVQLTWMDAKVGDWVVTPRIGKPVEVNALWYNALNVMASLSKELGEDGEAQIYEDKAKKVKANFVKAFWNEHGQCLYDCVDGDSRNDDVRPNQLYAVSLTFPVLKGDKAKKMLSVVTEKLLTPRGLRTLSSDFVAYVPYYGGNQWQRDSAYHQGTVWSFLLGPYVDALVKIGNGAGHVEAEKILRTFFEHLDEAGVGSVSEIFDAEPPHYPRGCIAQAWGVAEILRVVAEYRLFQTKKQTAPQVKVQAAKKSE